MKHRSSKRTWCLFFKVFSQHHMSEARHTLPRSKPSTVTQHAVPPFFAAEIKNSDAKTPHNCRRKTLEHMCTKFYSRPRSRNVTTTWRSSSKVFHSGILRHVSVSAESVLFSGAHLKVFHSHDHTHVEIIESDIFYEHATFQTRQLGTNVMS